MFAFIHKREQFLVLEKEAIKYLYPIIKNTKGEIFMFKKVLLGLAALSL